MFISEIWKEVTLNVVSIKVHRKVWFLFLFLNRLIKFLLVHVHNLRLIKGTCISQRFRILYFQQIRKFCLKYSTRQYIIHSILQMNTHRCIYTTPRFSISLCWTYTISLSYKKKKMINFSSVLSSRYVI